MRKRRILVLTHPDLIPDETYLKKEVQSVEWRTDYHVVKNLRKLGHTVKVLGVESDLSVIRKEVEKFKPDIAFNLLEEFHGEAMFDQNVVSYLELLQVPYTGCNPRGLILSRDKALCKKILTYHNIPVPEFEVFPRNRLVKRSAQLKFPLIVKSLVEEASLGISQNSIVYDDEKLEQRVEFIHKNLRTDAIAEQYIEGREFYVGILGNSKLKVFPTWELLFLKAPQELPRIATRKVKWDQQYQKKYGITSGKARNLPLELENKIKDICKRSYRALEINGYARIDLRLSKQKELYVIEVNPNPDLCWDEDFGNAAQRAGINYIALLSRILNLGLKWNPTSIYSDEPSLQEHSA